MLIKDSFREDRCDMGRIVAIAGGNLMRPIKEETGYNKTHSIFIHCSNNQ